MMIGRKLDHEEKKKRRKGKKEADGKYWKKEDRLFFPVSFVGGLLSR